MTVSRFKRFKLGTGLTGTDLGSGVIEISASGSGGTADPADDTSVWMPLVDSDGTCVLDSSGVIPTLIPLV